MTDRHAYLIMCHTNFDQLNILLQLLDDKRNDIYLHIDKKTKNYSENEIRSHSVNSNLFFIKPMFINWGGDSQIKLEIKLLSEAVKTQHDYYHLISGMDLPLKTQDEIHSFFSQHFGYDFVSLEREHPHNISKCYMDRVNYYYVFQNYINRGSKGFLSKLRNVFLSKLQNVHIRIQKLTNTNRTKHTNIEFQKGANWFSITHNTACYILNEFNKYKKYFRYTLCADELFLQTMLIHSPQVNRIKDENLRCIDWRRGNPYTFRLEDYDMLMNSNKLFARKFDINVDESIIYKIRDTLIP